MLPGQVRWMSELYGKEIIAFGTGKVGRVLIPYLEKEQNVNILGVTNSRIDDKYAGCFGDTKLPLRSLSEWAQIYPDATILITIIDQRLLGDVIDFCRKAGFVSVLPISKEFLLAVTYANLYLPDALTNENLEMNKYWVAQVDTPIFEAMCYANELRDLHKASFSEFKRCHTGQTVAIVASGPSMNYYTPIQDIPHIGVNTVFKRKDLKLDFYFAGDYMDEPDWYQELKHFNFVKFFAQSSSPFLRDVLEIPENIVVENSARKYFVSESNTMIYGNIEYHPLANFESIVFSAINFAIYTHPQKILLVGCDCGGDSHFDGIINDNIPKFSQMWVEAYKRVKQFVERYYPEIEIISINPVGLKGLFHDVYTESYLSAHPEIDRTTCEILDSSFLKQEDLSQK